ncbi:MAG TPA: LacI family DNA-binding transcriptional regulator [Roseiarcus sp.]|nr:LacI family DNA-binding transcriptional regulator [Roseiarcus sp.]
MSDSTDGAKRTASRATSFDVAALARVSQSAVSRAFTPGASIAKEKRDRVLEAARKLNYVPNSIASSLSTKRTNIVAVILGNLRNPFYVHVLEAFSQRLKALGRQILVFTVEPGADSDDAILDALRYQIDAIILTAAQISTRMTSICHQRGIPIVLFNRYIPGSDASGVRCDNVGGGRLIAEAFLAAGARSFAMITGDPRGTTSQDRVRGFVERLLEGGIRRAAIEEAPGLSSYDGAAAAVLALFERRDRPRPDALFGINDIMAMGAIDMLRGRLGLTAPRDMLVAGFDGILEANREPYRLTTVRQPIDDMVEQTLALMHLDDPDTPIARGVDMPLPAQLVWGETTPRPPGFASAEARAATPRRRGPARSRN